MLIDKRDEYTLYRADLLEESLQSEQITAPLFLYSTLASTNKTAKEFVLSDSAASSDARFSGNSAGNTSAGPLPCFAILAESQTAGRGRLGRSFHSPAGCGIYLTVVLPTPKDEHAVLRLTTAVSVGVTRALLRVTGLETQIKWVNDIYLRGKKVSGILCEGIVSPVGSLDSIAVGIGINLSAPNGFPDEIKEIAGALYMENSLGQAPMQPTEPLLTDRSCETPHRSCKIPHRSCKIPQGIPEHLIAALLHEVYACQTTLSDGSYLPEYKARSLVLGKEVILTDKRTGDPNTAKTALAVDIDEVGGLVVQYKDGTTESLRTGEITVRLT